jgi:hypothetical protein
VPGPSTAAFSYDEIQTLYTYLPTDVLTVDIAALTATDAPSDADLQAQRQRSIDVATAPARALAAG